MMKNMVNKTATILATVALLATISCRIRDVRTVVIDVPRLRGEECAHRLHRLLLGVDGVDHGALRLEPGRITVTYDSMKLALKNLEYAIAAAGFDANEIPADPQARERLPEQCR